jgi:hypothetical protein
MMPLMGPLANPAAVASTINLAADCSTNSGCYSSSGGGSTTVFMKLASLREIREKSKLARSVDRLVTGSGLHDLHQQICDAGAVDSIVALCRGDPVMQALAADLLIDIAVHEDRVHHLSKRGAVQASAKLRNSTGFFWFKMGAKLHCHNIVTSTHDGSHPKPGNMR